MRGRFFFGVAAIYAEDDATRDVDLPNYADARRTARAVFTLLQNHISAGEARDIAAGLPAEIREFWSEAGQPA